MISQVLLLILIIAKADLQKSQFTSEEHLRKLQLPTEATGRGVFYEKYHERYKRNVDSRLKEFLDRSSTIARISTSISLQHSLLKESIPIDDVIGEILNFGSIKLSDIVNFDSSKLNGLTSRIRSILKILAVDKDTLEAENKILKWKKLYEDSREIGDIKNISGTKEYFVDLKKFGNTHLAFVFKMGQDMEQLLTSLTEILTIIDNNSTQQQSDHFAKIQTLHKELESINGSMTNFNGTIGFLRSSAGLGDANLLSPVVKLIDLMKFRSDLSISLRVVVKNQAEEVIKFLSKLNDALVDLEKVSNLVTSRIGPLKMSKTYSAGFSKGAVDLGQLQNDIQKTWLSQLFLDRSIKDLSDILKPFLSVTDRFISIDKQLASISKLQLVNSIRKIQNLQTDLSSSSFPDSVTFSDVSSKIAQCDRKNSKAKDSWFNKIDPFLADWKVIVNTTSVLKNLDSATLQENMFNFRNLLVSSFTDFSNEAQSRKEYLGVLKKLKPDLDGIKKEIGDFSETLKNSNSLNPSFKRKINSLASSESVFVDFRDKRTTVKEYDVYNCLEVLVPRMEQTLEGFSTIRKLRNIDSKMADDLESGVYTISKMSKSVGELRKIPTEMKKAMKRVVRSPNNNSIPVLSIQDSQKIGETNRQLQNAIGLVDLDAEVRNLQNVGGKLNIDASPLMSGIQKTSQVVGKLDVARIKVIEDFGIQLKDLAGLDDVTFDTRKSLDELEVFIQDPKTKNDATTAKNVLEKVDTLDLEFTRKRSVLDTAPKAFKAFHDFLSSILKPIKIPMPVTSPPVQNASSVTGGSSSDSSTASVAESTSGGSVPWGAIIGGIIFVICIAGIIVAIVLWRNKKKKKEDEKRKEDERKKEDKKKEDEEKQEKEEKKANEQIKDAEDKGKKEMADKLAEIEENNKKGKETEERLRKENEKQAEDNLKLKKTNEENQKKADKEKKEKEKAEDVAKRLAEDNVKKAAELALVKKEVDEKGKKPEEPVLDALRWIQRHKHKTKEKGIEKHKAFLASVAKVEKVPDTVKFAWLNQRKFKNSHNLLVMETAVKIKMDGVDVPIHVWRAVVKRVVEL